MGRNFRNLHRRLSQIPFEWHVAQQGVGAPLGDAPSTIIGGRTRDLVHKNDLYGEIIFIGYSCVSYNSEHFKFFDLNYFGLDLDLHCGL